MCVVAFAWNAHPRWRLLLAGNRDEFHARPTAPLAWWPDDAGIAGGWIGARYGSRTLNPVWTRRGLAVVLLVAAARTLITD